MPDGIPILLAQALPWLVGILVLVVLGRHRGGHRAELRRHLVSGVHVQRQHQPVEPDRHELPPGRRPGDRAGQDHGRAGGHRLGEADAA